MVNGLLMSGQLADKGHTAHRARACFRKISSKPSTSTSQVKGRLGHSTLYGLRCLGNRPDATHMTVSGPLNIPTPTTVLAAPPPTPHCGKVPVMSGREGSQFQLPTRSSGTEDTLCWLLMGSVWRMSPGNSNLFLVPVIPSHNQLFLTISKTGRLSMSPCSCACMLCQHLAPEQRSLPLREQSIKGTFSASLRNPLTPSPCLHRGHRIHWEQ